MLFAAGCERPTAPEARDMARRIETEMLTGNFGHAQLMVMNAGPVGMFFSQDHPHGNHALVLNRDGRDATINGYVIEEVLLAPNGFGGPVVRRSLLGWPDDFGFAVHATADGASQLTLIHNGPGARTAVRASVEIGESIIERTCPTALGKTAFGDTITTVSCEFARYDVMAEAEFPRERDPSTMAAPRIHRLRVRRQAIPGARFVTRCRDVRGMEDMQNLYPGCMDRYAFWRDNALFARELNVDVTQMKREDGMYYRRIRGKRQRQDLTVAWTLHFPDGRLIETGSVSAATPLPYSEKASFMAHLANASPADRQIQILVAHESSFYAIAVLTLELGNEN